MLKSAKKRGKGRTLKAFAGTTTVSGDRKQLLVVASSYEQIAKMIKASLNRVRYSFLESHGAEAQRVLAEQREAVWCRDVTDYSGPYVQM